MDRKQQELSKFARNLWIFKVSSNHTDVLFLSLTFTWRSNVEEKPPPSFKKYKPCLVILLFLHDDTLLFVPGQMEK